MRAGLTTVAWYQAAGFAGAPFLLFCLLCMDPDWLQVKSKTAWSQGARGVQGNVEKKSTKRKNKNTQKQFHQTYDAMFCRQLEMSTLEKIILLYHVVFKKFSKLTGYW